MGLVGQRLLIIVITLDKICQAIIISLIREISSGYNYIHNNSSNNINNRKEVCRINKRRAIPELQHPRTVCQLKKLEKKYHLTSKLRLRSRKVTVVIKIRKISCFITHTIQEVCLILNSFRCRQQAMDLEIFYQRITRVSCYTDFNK